jgi:hypothetical protein
LTARPFLVTFLKPKTLFFGDETYFCDKEHSC